ncbi:MAG TPA: hypothetical protein VIJ55_05400 [Acetobacteraceae bacterium]
MRAPVLALCITGAILIVSVDTFAQRPSSANDLASLKAALGPYIGKTCSMKVDLPGTFVENIDEIVEKGGRIFVHHRPYSEYVWHDAGMLPLSKGSNGWAAAFVSDSGDELSYNPGPDPQHLRLKVVTPHSARPPREYLYACVPTKP